MAYLLLSLSGLLLLALGSYMSLAAPTQAAYLYPGQYFFVGGVTLSVIGMVSMLWKSDI